MYRGSAVNILLITLEKAFKLAANVFLTSSANKRGEASSDKRDDYRWKYWILSDQCSKTPMELLKIQLQDANRVDGQTKASATTAAGGIPKIGFLGATMLRDVSFSVVYFPLFARLNSCLRKANSEDAVFWWPFLCGCASGSISAAAVKPFDVVKTRLQLLKKGKGEVTYKYVPGVFTKILKTEGPLAFFKGAATRIMVKAPLFGIDQMVYFFGVADREYLLGVKP